MAALGVSAVLAIGASSPSTATWLTTGAGTGAGAATAMPTGTAPAGSASGATVSLSWTAAELGNGVAVAGYIVTRTNAATGGPGTVGGTCAGIVTTTSCTDTSVPAGPWIYTDTPVQLSWTGGVSPTSATITVP